MQRIHFVGIGGIGMSGIAEVLLNLGYKVSGSDISESDITRRLASFGAAICRGHRASNVGDADVVVVSSAVGKDNPEIAEAARRSIPVIPRAEMLAELLKMKCSVAVSGCHGKTTTTSMIATILAAGGHDPTMVIGGKLASLGTNARLGSGNVIVAEADESDGSFLFLAPSIAVITNIDREHVDYYPSIDDIKQAFLKFANTVPFYGSAVLCLDDAHVRDILPMIKRRIITYGIKEDAEYRASSVVHDGMTSRYRLLHKGNMLGEIELRVPGVFNIYNATAAVAVARELDMEFSTIRQGLALFTGVERRMQVKGCAGDVLVVDDYGHHPTEIRATLAAMKQAWQRRCIVVFQPHRYTRTEALFEDFADSFHDADHVVLTDIYAASEKEIPGVHSRFLYERIRELGYTRVSYVPELSEIPRHLDAHVAPGDVVVTLGAGTVWKVGEQFLKSRRETCNG